MDYHRGDGPGGDCETQPRGVLRRYERTNKKLSVQIPQKGEDNTRRLEHEAYRAVVRAFGAQGNTLTWTKERLMTELRKELRVTDEQHREILNALNDDETIRQLREMMNSQQEAPARKRGPGRPPGPKKRNKRARVEEEVVVPSSGAGVLKKLGDQRAKSATKAQPDSTIKREVDDHSFSLDDIEAELAQGRIEPPRIVMLKKAAQELKRLLLEEMAQFGLDENGNDKMEVDTPEAQDNAQQQECEEQCTLAGVGDEQHATVKDEG